MYNQGEIYYFNLDPAKGSEERKTRPCLVVSNQNYNRYFNTILVLPISSSDKYTTEKKYKVSPLFVPVAVNNISGTVLLQHIRCIDPKERVASPLKGKIDNKTLKNDIINHLKQFL